MKRPTKYERLARYGHHEPDAPARTYRVIWSRPDKGTHGTHFPGPVTHAQACRCLAALTRYPWRIDALEEIPVLP